jgi:hypothetical protein
VRIICGFFILRKSFVRLVGRAGFEPATNGLKARLTQRRKILVHEIQGVKHGRQFSLFSMLFSGHPNHALLQDTSPCDNSDTPYPPFCSSSSLTSRKFPGKTATPFDGFSYPAGALKPPYPLQITGLNLHPCTRQTQNDAYLIDAYEFILNSG